MIVTISLLLLSMRFQVSCDASFLVFSVNWKSRNGQDDAVEEE